MHRGVFAYADGDLSELFARRPEFVHVALGELRDYVLERETAARNTTDDPVTLFRYADALRQYGELGRAESLLRGLRESRRDFAPGRVNYALALALFEQERWEEGTEYYLDAITFMESPAIAHAMWEDIYLIANLDELQRFRQAESVDAYREFLRGFWKRRDINKTDVENERIAVHYERLRNAMSRTCRPAGVEGTTTPTWKGGSGSRLLTMRKPPSTTWG